MELNGIKNRIFPTLRDNENWNWFIEKVLEHSNKGVLEALCDSEQRESVVIPLTEFKASLVEVDTISSPETVSFYEDAPKYNDMPMKLSGLAKVYYFNTISAEFEGTQIVSPSNMAGMNLWVLDLDAKEIKSFVNVDNVAPVGIYTNDSVIESACKIIFYNIKFLFCQKFCHNIFIYLKHLLY